jgi:hypothetical protein
LGWIEVGLARLHSARYELLTTSFVIALTQGLMLGGRYTEALELVSATTDRCHGNGELFAIPELLRIKAKVIECASGGDSSDSEILLLESITWSRRQGASAWKLGVR